MNYRQHFLIPTTFFRLTKSTCCPGEEKFFRLNQNGIVPLNNPLFYTTSFYYSNVTLYFSNYPRGLNKCRFNNNITNITCYQPPSFSSPPCLSPDCFRQIIIPSGGFEGGLRGGGGGGGASMLNSKVQSYRSGDKFTDDN